MIKETKIRMNTPYENEGVFFLLVGVNRKEPRIFRYFPLHFPRFYPIESIEQIVRSDFPMQVTNLFNSPQLNEKSFPLRAGEVVQAVVKNRLDNNQATVMIKGQEVTATFEGNIPSQDRLFVSVVGYDDKGQAILKAVAPPESNQSNAITEMAKMGIDPANNSELKDAIQYLTKKGYKLTKEEISTLQRFIEKENGSFKDKLSVIEALAQRKLEITFTHLSAIEEALQGKSAASVLFDYLQDMADTELTQSNDINPELEKQFMQIFDSNSGIEENKPNEQPAHNVSNTKTEETNEQLINTKESNQHVKTEGPTQAPPVVENKAQPLYLGSKNILVTEIPKKLSQLTIDFNTMKRDAVKYLDRINQFFYEDKPIPAVQVKQMLESTINKLDNAILKGNYMLYTDMSTEKELLNASSQLAKAKDLLAKGSYIEANEIVKEVKALLNSVSFKPSVSKVMHFVSEQSLLQDDMEPSNQLLNELRHVIKPLSGQDSSARQVFETVKRMGLTHENQAAHALMGTSKSEVEPNLKMTLMRLFQAEDGQPRTVQSIEQALNNLTGQQLLNKPDSSGMQNIAMQLPLMLNDKVENVKVYINSQKKGKGIDWENCNLYFVLETEKLGNVGIHVHATNRNLSVTLKTDREGIVKKAGQFTDASLQRLNEIGYKVGAIQVKSFDGQEQRNPVQEDTAAPDTQSNPERGYDMKI